MNVSPLLCSHFDPNNSRHSACYTQTTSLEGLTEVFSLKLRHNQIEFKGQPLLQELPAPWPRQITISRLNAFSSKIHQTCLNAYQKMYQKIRRSEMQAIFLIRFLCYGWIFSKQSVPESIYGHLHMLVSLSNLCKSDYTYVGQPCPDQKDNAISSSVLALGKFRHERCFVVFVSRYIWGEACGLLANV